MEHGIKLFDDTYTARPETIDATDRIYNLFKHKGGAFTPLDEDKIRAINIEMLCKVHNQIEDPVNRIRCFKTVYQQLAFIESQQIVKAASLTISNTVFE